MASKGHFKRQRLRNNHAVLDQFDSLPWNSSLSQDDPFSLLLGSNDLQGGFLSLEEIDETQYGLDIPKPESEPRKEKPKAGKSLKKQNVGDDVHDNVEDEKVESSEKLKDKKKKKSRKKKKKKKDKEVEKVEEIDDKDVGDVVEPMEEENDDEENVVTEKDNKKKKNKKRKIEEIEEDEESMPDTVGRKVDVEEEPVDESDYYAWNELRLHPVIMKSIYRLGFKEPTPIQKACVPAAAHQGKDVVGAAETGSGKTLAFGLPIFQRLLEEKEKASNMVEESDEDDDNDDKVAPKGVLRALIITPTRELALQVTDHLKAISKDTGFRVVPIVGGMSSEKQVRLLKQRPEIVVGTPGRLWELMSGGDKHLAELHSLSFFVLDEADRMIENGHFHELQSIIDMLPLPNSPTEENPQNSQSCVTVSSVQRKKRQTFVFSATIALSGDFRKKLKRSAVKPKQSTSDSLDSIEKLSQRAGMRENVAIIDLTSLSIMANKLEESFIECREEDKDAYLYYILSVHGQGRTIVFCTSVAALRHLSSIMRTLGINVWTLHAQMQQRARLKAIDRFRENEHSILLATDVAARGIDIPGVRTVVHYQLPHSAEVYVHRSGRTARASADGCTIALISPKETSKFASLCKSFSKENFKRFPCDSSYMPEVMKRLSLARQIDKITRKDSKAKAKKSWLEKNAESIDFDLENEESDDERANTFKQKKATSSNVKKLQQELKGLLSRPLQPMSFSRRYLAGAGVTPLLHSQFQEMAKQKLGDLKPGANKRRMVVIGQDCVEPLQALRTAGQEVRMDVKEKAQKRENMENLKRKRKEEKKRLHDKKRKEKKKMKGLI